MWRRQRTYRTLKRCSPASDAAGEMMLPASVTEHVTTLFQTGPTARVHVTRTLLVTDVTVDHSVRWRLDQIPIHLRIRTSNYHSKNCHSFLLIRRPNYNLLKIIYENVWPTIKLRENTRKICEKIQRSSQFSDLINRKFIEHDDLLLFTVMNLLNRFENAHFRPVDHS